MSGALQARFYVVGGAVRDELLGLPASDRDWVVVGATPQQLLDLGYRPVGKDFPVFLHPSTGEEVALARTERKIAAGYHGFTFHAAPEVTLEQDLARRDLTINAFARADDGTLVDPFGGQADLRAGVLRHVSGAFVEDPVRLLRLARLAARFAHFSIAPETLALLRHMVAAGEVDALVPERVWQELSRGLMTDHPARLFAVLRDCGALLRLLPALDRSWSPAREAALACCAEVGAALAVRWACLVQGAGDAAALRALGLGLRVSSDCLELVDVMVREQAAVQASATLDAAGLMGLFERCDALRRAARFDALLLACACSSAAAAGSSATLAADAQRARLPGLLQAAMGVDTALLAQQAVARQLQGPAIGLAIRQARIARVQAALQDAPAL